MELTVEGKLIEYKPIWRFLTSYSTVDDQEQVDEKLVEASSA